MAPVTVAAVLDKRVEKRLRAQAKSEEFLNFRASVDELKPGAFASRRMTEGVLSRGQHAATPSLVESLVDVLAARDAARLTAPRRLVDARMREIARSPRRKDEDGASQSRGPT